MTASQGPWQQGGQSRQPPGGHPGYPSAPGGPVPGGPVQGSPQPGTPLPVGTPKPPTTLVLAFVAAIVTPLIATGALVAMYLVTNNYVSGMLSGAIVATDEDGDSHGFREETQIVAPFIHGIFIVLILVSLVLTVLWVLVGANVRKGKRGARTFLTFLSVVWLLVSVVGLIGGTIFWGMFTDYVRTAYYLTLPGAVLTCGYVFWGSALVGVIAFLVLAYAGPSSAHISAVTASPKQRA